MRSQGSNADDPPKPSPAPSAGGPELPPLTTVPHSTGAVPDDEESPPLPKVELETVYVFGKRPVPEVDVIASQHDTEIGLWNLGGKSGASRQHPGFHPATRVVIETKPLSGRRSLGGLSAGDVQAQSRKRGYWPFRLCFEDALRAGLSAGGNTVLRFSFDARGRVTYVRRMSSKLPAAASDCLRKRSYSLRFRPAPPRRVDVELTVHLGLGDVTLPPRDPQSEQPEWLEPVHATFANLNESVAACYLPALEQDPELWGRLALRVERDGSGNVRKATEWESRFPDDSVTRCVEQLLVGTPIKAPTTAALVAAWRLGRPG